MCNGTTADSRVRGQSTFQQAWNAFVTFAESDPVVEIKSHGIHEIYLKMQVRQGGANIFHSPQSTAGPLREESHS